jgi:hypothetical protein
MKEAGVLGIVMVAIVALTGAVLGLAPDAGRQLPQDLPVFTDITEKSGVHFKHSFGDEELSNIVEGTGSGVALLDYDNDGWLDIYFVNGRYRPDVNDNTGRKLKGKLTNMLLRNNHDGTFTDVTEKVGVGGGEGYGCSASAADYDGDGNTDLYVCNYGKNILYRNNGDGTFTDVTDKAGVGDERWSLSGVWFDYDKDGKLDLYVANYLEYDAGKFRSYYAAAGYPGPLSYSGQPDTLYHNNGDGTFTDVTKQADVYKPGGRAMSATAADLVNSGLLDVFVANDSMECYYLRNLGKGRFAEEALQRGLAFSEGGQGVSHMGPCIGDVDRDGRLDIFIPDMNFGCLLMNRGDHFEDRTTENGLAVILGQYTGWGGCLFDYDNDGWLDIFCANGDAHHEYVQDQVMVRNDGTGHFVDVAKRSGDYFKRRYVGRGAAVGDLFNDGNLDVVAVNLNDRARVLRNGGAKNNWLAVIARLPNGKTDAIGARVTVTTGSLVQIQDLIPVVGYLSQSDPRPHFGLGKAKQADKVEIRWPDGTVTQLNDVKANQFMKAVKPSK